MIGNNNSALVVSEKTSRLLVDHRLSLKIYYRAADSILRQARIYRKENNLIDLYILLLRFSSLVMETIPQHRDYRTYLGREKNDFRKRLLDVLTELETLKPLVRKEIARYNNAFSHVLSSTKDSTIPGTGLARSQSFSPVATDKAYSQIGYGWTGGPRSKPSGSNPQEYSQAVYKWEGDLNRKPPNLETQQYPQALHKGNEDLSSQPADWRQQYTGPNYYGTSDIGGPVDSQSGYTLSGDLSNKQVFSGALLPPYNLPSAVSIGDRMSSLSLNIPTPTTESLSRHSFLSSSVRRAVASSGVLSSKVQYPSLIDAPTMIPSLDQDWRSPSPVEITAVPVPPIKAVAEPVFYNETDMLKFEEKHSSLVDSAVSLHSQLNRQPSPPPVAAEVQNITAFSSTENGNTDRFPCDVFIPPAEQMKKFTEESVQSRNPKQLHISAKLMDEFMGVASSNTKNNLETCGVLAGSLKEGVFYVTTLIIPKQEATANSCSTISEEDIFEYQDKHELFQFGWIHTHPTQSCFMSSIDLHTHYSYQVMLPEAIAIVMAPTDSSRKYGIFRLAEPSGVKVIQLCEKRGFHPHNEPEDGGPIYEPCGHVILDPKVACGVVDLR